jgi:hypothetical protein
MGNILPNKIKFLQENKESLTSDKTLTLSSQIDDIAIHYILKQNTIDLLRLSDKEYYDNLIILTNKIFDDKLSPLEIGVLSHKIKGESTIQNAVFNLIPSNDKLKNQMIQNISKYYIKILTIYSAIVSTIDPQYSYEDENGEKQLFYLKDIEQYKNIPHNSQPVLSKLSNPMNLCRKRITILKNKLDDSDESEIILNPGEKICNSPMIFKLTDEIGIKELDLLYYDVFDYDTKEWSKQSKEMKKKYNKDLTLFYQVFTGNKIKPKEIQSFKDIELLDFKGLNYCNDTFFVKDMIVPKHHRLIQKYLNKIKLIEDSNALFRQKLIKILKQLFLIKNVENAEPSYIINPELTMDMILQIENETRDTIIKLYSNCERYFIQAILIFEELYEELSFNIANNKLNNTNNHVITNPIIMNNMNSNIEPLYNQPFNTTEPNVNVYNKTKNYEYIPKENKLFESPPQSVTNQYINNIYSKPISPSQPNETISLPQTYNQQQISPSQPNETISLPQTYNQQQIPPNQKSEVISLPQTYNQQQIPPNQKSEVISLPQTYNQQQIPPNQKSEVISLPQTYNQQQIPSNQKSEVISLPQTYNQQPTISTEKPYIIQKNETSNYNQQINQTEKPLVKEEPKEESKGIFGSLMSVFSPKENKPTESSIETSTEIPTKPSETSTEIPTKPSETSTEIPTKPSETSTEIPTKPSETSTEIPTKPSEIPTELPTKPYTKTESSIDILTKPSTNSTTEIITEKPLELISITNKSNDKLNDKGLIEETKPITKNIATQENAIQPQKKSFMDIVSQSFKNITNNYQPLQTPISSETKPIEQKREGIISQKPDTNIQRQQ